MSPHSADDNKGASKRNSAIEGEIIIDHSDHNKSAEVAPKVGIKSPPLVVPELEHLNEKTPPPPQIPAKDIPKAPPQQNQQTSVVVPGGVSGAAMNPAGYFKSKYLGRRSVKHFTPTTPQPILAQPVVDTRLQAEAAAQPRSFDAGKKKMFGIAFVLTMVVLTILGYVFGVYIPNRPENVYSSGFDRTGKAFESIINNATDSETLDKMLNAEMSGLFEYRKVNETITGDIAVNLARDKVQINVAGVGASTGNADKQYSAEIISAFGDETTEAATFFKSVGLGFFGLEKSIPNLSKYNGKWIAAEGSSSKQIALSSTSLLSSGLLKGTVDNVWSAASSEPLTNNDINELSKTTSAILREYVFTKDTTKSIFVEKEYVGKEDTSTGQGYHYIVGLNKQNYIAFCKALNMGIIDSSAYHKQTRLEEDAITEEKVNSDITCEKQNESINEDAPIEIWIDANSKLIHKFRFVKSVFNGSYVEYGQNYRGNERLEFFYNFSSEGESKATKAIYAVDLSSGKAEFKLEESSGTDETQEFLILSLSSQPSEADFEILRPDGTIKLSDIAKKSGNSLESLLNKRDEPASESDIIY